MNAPNPAGEIVPRRRGAAGEAPARFEPWPDGVYERARELWSTVAGRNCAAVERLLASEAEGATVPSASTVRKWSAAGDWDVQADTDLEQTRGRTLRRLQAGWLAALELAQATLIEGMTGGLDACPYGGSARIKSAEIVLRTIERAGLLATLPDAPLPDGDALAALSPIEKSHLLRETYLHSKAR